MDILGLLGPVTSIPSVPGPDSEVSTMNLFGLLASPTITPSPYTFTFSAEVNWLSGLTFGLNGELCTGFPSKLTCISWIPTLVGVYDTSVLPGEMTFFDTLGLLGPLTSTSSLPSPASEVSTVKVAGLLSLAKVTPSPYTLTWSAA